MKFEIDIQLDDGEWRRLPRLMASKSELIEVIVKLLDVFAAAEKVAFRVSKRA